MAQHLTKADFLEKVFDFENKKDWDFQGELPAVIDFYADWCGPCKMVAPIIEELSKEYAGRLKVAKINVEKAPNVASQFGVMSIPTLIFFKEGKVHDQIVGALNKVQLKTKIEENIDG